MKKKWLLFLLVCLLSVSVALTACGGDDNEVQEPDPFEDLINGDSSRDEDDRQQPEDDKKDEEQPDSGLDPFFFEVDLGFEKHEDRDGYAKLDIRLPLVNSSGTEAMKLNGLIDAAFTEEKAMDLDDVAAAEYGFVYPWIHIDYDEVELDGIYAINVTTTYTSAEGAASYQGIRSFYYDGDMNKILSKTEYIGMLGFSKSDIEDLFMEDVGNDLQLSRMSYSDLEQMFYIDGRGNVVFHFSM